MREAGSASRRRPPWSAGFGAFLLDDDATWTRRSPWPSEAGAARTPTPWSAPCSSEDGEVVGRGWHLAPGEPHAEAMALPQAGERARGATLFCTLEPCSSPWQDAALRRRADRRRASLGRSSRSATRTHRWTAAGFEALRQGGVAVQLAGEAWAARASRPERGLPQVPPHRAPAGDLQGGDDARRQSRGRRRRRPLDQLPRQSQGGARAPCARGRRHGRRRHGAPGRPRAHRAAGRRT